MGLAFVKLSEALNTPVNYNWRDKGKSRWLGMFDVEGVNYIFEASDSTNAGDWNVIFTGQGTMDITNTGNAFTVFATIFAMLKEFVLKMKPKMFYFSAKEQSRRKLYQRFAKMIDKMLPQYNIQMNNKDGKIKDSSAWYYFKRK
jgi:hypothetical protein